MSDKWIKPIRLEEGDYVGVIAPSDIVEEKYLMKGVELLESWGLRVMIGRHVFDNDFNFAAGSPEARMADWLEMVGNTNIKLIWAASGGYAATQLWPLMSKEIYTKIGNNPKILIGYSDIGTLNHILTTCGIVSVHGPNLSGLPYWNNESIEWTRRLVFGEVKKGEKVNLGNGSISEGNVSARLLISNLDTLVTSIGTPFDPIESGKDNLIIGLEEAGQYKSDIQRQLDRIVNHRNKKRIKGFILGRFGKHIKEKGYEDWDKHNTLEMIAQRRIEAALGEIPVAITDAYGHLPLGEKIKELLHLPEKPQKFIALPNGIKSKLEVNKGAVSLTFLEDIFINN